MSTAADRVQDCVEDDIFLQVALARGIANLRAVARWLQKERDVPGTVPAIVQTLRRRDLADHVGPLESGRSVLAGSRVNLRAGICVLVVPRTVDTRGQLAQLAERIDFSRGHTLISVPGTDHVAVAIDVDCLDEANATLGDNILQVASNLVALTVRPPRDQVHEPGTLGLIVTALTAQGVDVRFLAGGIGEHTILVASEDQLQAFSTLQRVASRPRPV